MAEIRHRHIIISFMGIDGSGKSTLSLELHNELKRMDIVSAYYHVSLPLTNLIPRFIRKFLWNRLITRSRKATKEIIRGDTSIRKTYKLKNMLLYLLLHLYLLFVLVNVAIGYLYIVRLKFKSNIVLCDRYFYDYVIDYEDNLPRWLIRVYIKIVPQPDAIFFLKVSPNIAYIRDREHEQSYYAQQQARMISFLSFLENTGCRMFIIDTSNLSVMETCRIVLNYIKRL